MKMSMKPPKFMPNMPSVKSPFAGKKKKKKKRTVRSSSGWNDMAGMPNEDTGE